MTPSSFRALRTFCLTAATMVSFAANSVIARLAMRDGQIDPGSFTVVRILSGAVALVLLVGLRNDKSALLEHGSWRAAFALTGYAVAFSFAYVSIEAGAGALILFAAVQITMIGAGMLRGLQPRAAEWIGLATAFAGLAYLISPGFAAPSPFGAVLMATAGAAWGFYSLAARGVRSAASATAANFVRTAPLTALGALIVWAIGGFNVGVWGLALAATSGMLTSGVGYVIWYEVLRDLSPFRAAIVQLTVPVIAATAGVVFLGEKMSWRLAIATAAVLGGVALAVLWGGRRHRLDRSAAAKESNRHSRNPSGLRIEGKPADADAEFRRDPAES